MADADLAGPSEDAALISSVGQGVKTLDGGRLQFRFISKTMDRIRRRLVILERRLR